MQTLDATTESFIHCTSERYTIQRQGHSSAKKVLINRFLRTEQQLSSPGSSIEPKPVSLLGWRFDQHSASLRQHRHWPSDLKQRWNRRAQARHERPLSPKLAPCH